MQLWRKVNETSIYYLCWRRVFTQKMDTRRNNSEKSSKTKESEHKASGYSMLTHCSFDPTKIS